MSVKEFMHNIDTTMPDSGRKVTIQLLNGDKLNTHTTQVYFPNGEAGIFFYRDDNGKSVDINLIKGWRYQTLLEV